MKLSEVRNLIIDSYGRGWHHLACWGGGGPSFRDEFSSWDSRDAGHVVTAVQSASHVLVYEDNVNLTVSFGLRTGPWGYGDQELTFEFLKKFPSRIYTAYYLDVFWCNALIDRIEVVSVDGGRAILPIPTLGVNEDVDVDFVLEDPLPESVSRYEVALARIAHNAEHQASTFDTYLARSGITVDSD